MLCKLEELEEYANTHKHANNLYGCITPLIMWLELWTVWNRNWILQKTIFLLLEKRSVVQRCNWTPKVHGDTLRTWKRFLLSIEGNTQSDCQWQVNFICSWASENRSSLVQWANWKHQLWQVIHVISRQKRRLQDEQSIELKAWINCKSKHVLFVFIFWLPYRLPYWQVTLKCRLAS